MRILLTSNTMTYLSGQALYVYELARALPFEHDITVASHWGNNDLLHGLNAAGVRCFTQEQLEDSTYDLVIVSGWKPEIKAAVFINVVHSEYDDETPLPDCDMYVCIRPSIQEHIIAEHGIPREKTVVIYNGIDRIRFSPKKKLPRDFTKVVVPCTLGVLREKFLNAIIDEATVQRQIFIFGDNYGAKLHSSPYVHIAPSKFHIEKDIADADEIAGILLGRVNLEANSCGVASWIYDPVTLEKKFFLMTEEEFDARHNIVHVAKQILSLPVVGKVYEYN